MKAKHFIPRFSCIAFILCFNLSTVAAQPVKDSLDQFLLNKMSDLRIPGLQVAVIRNGKIIKLGHYGLANVQDSVAVTDQTLFPINSITKAFVGLAITQLAENGKLDLDAPVSKYLDSLPLAWQPVTITQLLTHTSGLPDIWGDNAVTEGQENAAWSRVQTMPMDFKTGEKFSYNQTNYLLLGKIIDKLSGQPFDQYIRTAQLDIAGMPLTFFGDAHEVHAHTARSYTFFQQVNGRTIRSNRLGNVWEEVAPFLRTAAGMNSTAQEMARWVIALQQGSLLKDKKTLQVLWTPGLLNNGQQSGFSKLLNGYALGTPVITRAEHPAIAPIGGGRSAVFIYPSDDLSVIVLTNLQASNPESFVDEIAGFYIPDMRAVNGFGLPPLIKAFRAKLLKRGFDKAVDVYKEEKKKDVKYQLQENEVNAWGYTLLRQGQQQAALEIFKLNVFLYPQSSNVFDSLGELYADLGNKELAVKNYKRSLQLDPKNTNASDYLKKVGAE